MQKQLYYSNLTKYKPMGGISCCGQPFFWRNIGWGKPFTSVIIINGFFLMLMLGLYKWSNNEDFRLYCLIDVLSLALFDVSYFLTQFISPGIVYRPSISHLQNKNYQFCEFCKMYICKDDDENHCFECKVCVYGVDHHCGWFQKCISGPNKWSFYIFLLSTFAMVIAFMGSFLGIVSGN